MGLKLARTKEFDVKIGQNIKNIRNRTGITQEALGESLGITFQQIQKYERGSNRVSAAALVHFQKVLGCDLKDFYDGIDIDGARGETSVMSDAAVKVSLVANGMPRWKQTLLVNIARQIDRAGSQD